MFILYYSFLLYTLFVAPLYIISAQYLTYPNVDPVFSRSNKLFKLFYLFIMVFNDLLWQVVTHCSDGNSRDAILYRNTMQAFLN